MSRKGVDTMSMSVERYPAVPKPSIVDCSVVSRKGVETKSLKLTVDRYPAVPKPSIVDCKVVSRKGVETKSRRLIDERYPDVPRPTTVLVSSDTVTPLPAVDI